MGLEPVTSAITGAMLYQLSYKATHWERGQLIEFISPVRSEMMWKKYTQVYFACTLYSHTSITRIRHEITTGFFTMFMSGLIAKWKLMGGL